MKQEKYHNEGEYVVDKAVKLLHKHLSSMRENAMKGPGRSDREGLSIVELVRLFPDDDAGRRWFETVFWPRGPYCPHCGSFNVQSDVQHPKMTTGLKGVSSMKLHRDLGVTQKTAWHLAHRIRAAYALEHAPFTNEVEVDETYVGGRKRGGPGRGTAGKAVVAGARERTSRLVRANVVPNIKKGTLHDYVRDNVDEEATVFTDELASYRGIPNPHRTVNHGSREYVRDKAHTNGIESFWSMLKRARKAADSPGRDSPDRSSFLQICHFSLVSNSLTAPRIALILTLANEHGFPAPSGRPLNRTA